MLRDRLDGVRDAGAGARRIPTFVLEWTDPPFDAGHWVPDMVDAAGGLTLLASPGQYSHEVTWNEVRSAAPEILVVAPCGYALEDATRLASDEPVRSELRAAVAATGGQVWAVDACAFFARPGPRLVDGVELLAGILHPDRWPAPGPPRAERVGS
jgi:iron complex transport system substrate-binding protein